MSLAPLELIRPPKQETLPHVRLPIPVQRDTFLLESLHPKRELSPKSAMKDDLQQKLQPTRKSLLRLYTLSFDCFSWGFASESPQISILPLFLS